MAATDGKVWYAVIKNKADGPHTTEEIHEMIHLGKLSYADFVFRPGLTQWTPISEFKEFERRGNADQKTEITQLKEIAETAASEGWILLVRHVNSVGQENLIQSGPYSIEQVREKLAKNEIRFEDYIWQKGFKQWTKIGSLEGFDRRRPRNFETQPKPKFSDSVSLEKTVVMDKAANQIPPQVPSTAAENNSKQAPFPRVDPERSPEFRNNDRPKEHLSPAEHQSDPLTDHSIDELPLKRGGKKLFIAATGAVFAMIFAYFGLNAYKEVLLENIPVSLKSKFLEQFQSKPRTKALAVALKPTPQLKLVTIRSNTPAKPQVVFETNLPVGTAIDVNVSALPGKILNYPRLNVKKEIRVITGQLPTIDFTNDDLPPGDYKVTAQGAGMSVQGELKVGLHDEAFQKTLTAYQSELVNQEKNERLTLFLGLKFLNEESSSLQKIVKSPGNKPIVRTKKLTAWRKVFAKKLNSFSTKRDEKTLIYPEAHTDFVQAQQRLFESSKAKIAGKNSRSIASLQPKTATEEYQKKLQEFLLDLKELNFRVQK